MVSMPWLLRPALRPLIQLSTSCFNTCVCLFGVLGEVWKSDCINPVYYLLHYHPRKTKEEKILYH